MILVTGASGTVGQAVVAALGDRSDVWRATRSDQPGPGERAFDLTRPETYAPALDGIRALFLLFPPGLAQAEARFAALLRVARQSGVERAVFLSIRNADRLPLPHRRIERVVEASGLAWTHLRANDFFQNFATVEFYRESIRAGRLIGPGGRSRTSYIDVRDVGAAAATVLMAAAGHEGRAYSLTGPAKHNLQDIGDAIGAVLGRPITVSTPSPPGFFAAARIGGAPTALALVMTSIGLVARLGYSRGVDPDLRDLLPGPRRGLTDFARDYANCWRSANAT